MGVERTYEVRDDGGTSSDEEPDEDVEDRSDLQESAAAGGAADGRFADEDVSDGGMIIDGGLQEPDSQKERDINSAAIAAHEIDAYWLQRQIGSIYNDAHVQQTKTQEALQLLSGLKEDGEDMPLREIENDLMELFDYEQPEIVGKLISNREKIVWVTKWRRAEDDESRYLVGQGHGRSRPQTHPRRIAWPRRQR